MELDIITKCDERWSGDYKNEISFERKKQSRVLSDMLPILSRMKREAQRPQSSGPFQTLTPMLFDVWEHFIHRKKTTTDQQWEKATNIHSETRRTKSV